MNVLILAQYFPPDLGGSTTRAYNMAKGLLLNGCEVTVVTAFPHYPHGKIPREYWRMPLKVEWMARIRVVRTFILPLQSKGLFRRLLQFWSFILSSLFALPMVGNVDVIWAANPDVFAMIPAAIYGWLKKSPIVLNVDDLSLDNSYQLGLLRKGSLMAKIVELFTRACYMKADAVTPISPGYVQQIKEYGVDANQIHVVKGGVDLAVFSPRNSQLMTGKKFVALYSGAFSIGYDFGQILRAAKIVSNRIREVEFVIQGGGELANHIRAGVRELKLRNVQIIDRIFSREEVATLLNFADVLILPLADFGKPYSGISSKLYEYQAVGKPIICCAEGQPADYVEKTGSGIVVKPGDHHALAKVIIALKESPDIARAMGENGRKCVESDLSIEVIGLEMKEILERLTRR